MSTGGYKITDQGAMYFVSFAVVGWVDVFTRKEYSYVVIEKFKILSGEKRFGALCLVYDEQPVAFNNFC